MFHSRVAISGEERVESDSVKRVNVNLCRLMDSAGLNYFDRQRKRVDDCLAELIQM